MCFHGSKKIVLKCRLLRETNLKFVLNVAASSQTAILEYLYYVRNITTYYLSNVKKLDMLYSTPGNDAPNNRINTKAWPCIFSIQR
jgi:hypothetical protein